jgi:hypothetical protein
LLALLGLLGPLGYPALVTVLGLLWDGYDPVRDTQSQLGAVDAPHRVVMNVAGFTVAWQVASFWLGLVSLASGPIIAAELVDGPTGCSSGRPCGRLWSR